MSVLSGCKPGTEWHCNHTMSKLSLSPKHNSNLRSPWVLSICQTQEKNSIKLPGVNDNRALEIILNVFPSVKGPVVKDNATNPFNLLCFEYNIWQARNIRLLLEKSWITSMVSDRFRMPTPPWTRYRRYTGALDMTGFTMMSHSNKSWLSAAAQIREWDQEG